MHKYMTDTCIKSYFVEWEGNGAGGEAFWGNCILHPYVTKIGQVHEFFKWMLGG